MNYKKLSIIIPAYNEEKTILEVLKKVLTVKIPLQKEIIVVNNNSNDNTSEIVKKYIKRNKLKNVLLINEKTPGKGAAVRKGLKKITGDIIIMQDADLEYDPNDYINLIKPILKNQTKVVYGDRLGYKNKKSYLSFYFGGRLMTLIGNMLFRTKIKDINTCYKVWASDLTKNINFKENGFAFDFAEISPFFAYKLKKINKKIVNVPIHYYPRSKDEGKKINWKDGIYGIYAMLKYSLKKNW